MKLRSGDSGNVAVIEVAHFELVHADALAGGFGAESVGVGGNGGGNNALGGVESGREGGNDTGGEDQDFAGFGRGEER